MNVSWSKIAIEWARAPVINLTLLQYAIVVFVVYPMTLVILFVKRENFKIFRKVETILKRYFIPAQLPFNSTNKLKIWIDVVRIQTERSHVSKIKVPMVIARRKGRFLREEDFGEMMGIFTKSWTYQTKIEIDLNWCIIIQGHSKVLWKSTLDNRCREEVYLMV